MSVKDALEMAKKHKAEIVDFKFIDVPGLWQHFSIPATELSGGCIRARAGIRKHEVDAIRLRPHPWEFALYFDI